MLGTKSLTHSRRTLRNASEPRSQRCWRTSTLKLLRRFLAVERSISSYQQSNKKSVKRSSSPATRRRTSKPSVGQRKRCAMFENAPCSRRCREQSDHRSNDQSNNYQRRDWQPPLTLYDRTRTNGLFGSQTSVNSGALASISVPRVFWGYYFKRCFCFT